MWIAFAFLSFLLTNFVHCGPLFKRDQGSSTRCLNVYPECPEWKQNGMCEQNREYMAATCPVTCGFCGDIESKAGYKPYESLSNIANSQETNGDNIMQEFNNNIKAKMTNSSDKSISSSLQSKNSEDLEIKGLKATNSDENEAQENEELATNEQIHPSSKHIEEEPSIENNANDRVVLTDHTASRQSLARQHKPSLSSGFSGSGEDDATVKLINNKFPDLTLSENKLYHQPANKRYFYNISNQDQHLFTEGDANEVDNDGEQSGDERDSSGNVERDDISSGTLSQEAQPVEEDKYKQLDKSDKEHDERNRQKNIEEERTENAEKYEDEESENENKGKQVQERRNGKKDLMTSMMADGKLRAIAVTKGKARNKVPDEESKPVSGESDENSSTDIDLDLKEAGLDAFSGSGQYDDKLHLTLRQTYNKNFDDKNSPAYKILSGNFQKDMDAALGDENEISNIDFSEVEVEGNPKTSGKVRVNFKFAGNYEKLSKIVKSGNINGLLVMKNSLEGPMLDVKDSK